MPEPLTLDDLRAMRKPTSVMLLLAGGLAHSRKTVVHSGGKFHVKNHIDGTRQHLTEAELWTESNIGEGLDKGALYLDS